MTKLKKLLPALAILFGITVVTVQSAIAKWDTSDEQEWRLKDGGTASNAEDYELSPGSRDNCQGPGEVCAISAPADAEETDQPDFSMVPGLQSALENNQSHPNITYGTYIEP